MFGIDEEQCPRQASSPKIPRRRHNGGTRGGAGRCRVSSDCRKWTPGTRTSLRHGGRWGKRKTAGLRPPRAARQTKLPSTTNAECAPAPEGETHPEGKIRTTKDGRPWPAEAAASFPPDDYCRWFNHTPVLGHWPLHPSVHPPTHLRDQRAAGNGSTAPTAQFGWRRSAGVSHSL